MQILINESQYEGLVSRIRNLERELELYKKNLKISIRSDFVKFIEDNFIGDWEGHQWFTWRPDVSYIIKPEYIIKKLENNKKHNPILVVFYLLSDDKLEVGVSYDGFAYKSWGWHKDTDSRLKWYYTKGEMSQDEFFNKVNKLITKKISIPYQDKLLDKLESNKKK